MHLRRALLLFALVLGLTAIAASVAPPPATNDPASDEPVPTTATNPAAEDIRIGFRYPPAHKRVVTRRVPTGRPLVVLVSSEQAGNAEIPLLGRVTSVTSEDPAEFDVLISNPGRYDVQFTPAGGNEPQRLGRIVANAR